METLKFGLFWSIDYVLIIIIDSIDNALLYLAYNPYNYQYQSVF